MARETKTNSNKQQQTINYCQQNKNKNKITQKTQIINQCSKFVDNSNWLIISIKWIIAIKTHVWNVFSFISQHLNIKTWLYFMCSLLE